MLSPLPIQGIFYYWSCDLAKELPQTSRGNVYIMIMIEHFSKWVELVVLPDKSSHSTGQTFLQQVLSRFGACVECLTDQGLEFRREFRNLLDHALINHHQISRDHPQVDGLEGRMVQTCKKGLRKICLIGNKEDCDLALPYIAMGYKMFKHASISLLTFYFLGDIPFHPLPLLLKWTRLWTWTPQPLGLGSSQKRLLYSRGLCPWPWRTCPLHSIETLYSIHTHKVVVTNLR